MGREKEEIHRNFFLSIHHSNIPIVTKFIRSKNLTDGSKLDERKSG